MEVADEASTILQHCYTALSQSLIYPFDSIYKTIKLTILYCTSGKELAGTGCVLLHHFETEGTPVMIEGGVLAHTILGIEYNEQSGDIRLKILLISNE